MKTLGIKTRDKWGTCDLLCEKVNPFKTTEGSTPKGSDLNCKRNIVTLNGVMFNYLCNKLQPWE
jgi:hypothetical protein